MRTGSNIGKPQATASVTTRRGPGRHTTTSWALAKARQRCRCAAAGGVGDRARRVASEELPPETTGSGAKLLPGTTRPERPACLCPAATPCLQYLSPAEVRPFRSQRLLPGSPFHPPGLGSATRAPLWLLGAVPEEAPLPLPPSPVRALCFPGAQECPPLRSASSPHLRSHAYFFRKPESPRRGWAASGLHSPP